MNSTTVSCYEFAIKTHKQKSKLAIFFFLFSDNSYEESTNLTYSIVSSNSKIQIITIKTLRLE